MGLEIFMQGSDAAPFILDFVAIVRFRNQYNRAQTKHNNSKKCATLNLRRISEHANRHAEIRR